MIFTCIFAAMPLDRIILPIPGIRVAFWKISEPADALLQMYNPGAAERDFIAGLPELRQQHYLASRLLVQTFYPGVEIQKDEAGKPHLKDSTVHFSWSHSGQYAAAIFNENGPAGIDIETLSPRILRIEDKFCNQTDKKHIHKTRHSESLLIIWGAKESLFKWYGKKEVDFRRHMTVSAFDMGDEARFSASFHKPETQCEMMMEYMIFDGHAAVWTLAEANEQPVI